MKDSDKLAHKAECSIFHGHPGCDCGQMPSRNRDMFRDNTTRLMEIMNAISEERKFQDRKHGHPSDNPHSVGAWLLCIEAELAEAKEACIKGGDGRNNVINEVIQIAALCVACLEQHGIDPLPGRTV